MLMYFNKEKKEENKIQTIKKLSHFEQTWLCKCKGPGLQHKVSFGPPQKMYGGAKVLCYTQLWRVYGIVYKVHIKCTGKCLSCVGHTLIEGKAAWL